MQARSAETRGSRPWVSGARASNRETQMSVGRLQRGHRAPQSARPTIYGPAASTMILPRPRLMR